MKLTSIHPKYNRVLNMDSGSRLHHQVMHEILITCSTMMTFLPRSSSSAGFSSAVDDWQLDRIWNCHVIKSKSRSLSKITSISTSDDVVVIVNRAVLSWWWWCDDVVSPLHDLQCWMLMLRVWLDVDGETGSLIRVGGWISVSFPFAQSSFPSLILASYSSTFLF